ncbi:MAG: ATP-dependent helicase [Acholeplasma sp.]|nr:ATP-dependent helicase [Acholeplasma sp.]
MMEMNEKQKLVIGSKDKHIFLLAGAGTGKTRVITEKIRQLIRNEGFTDSVLVLSFTNKSVLDIKKRLAISADNLLVTTFHGLCYRIVSSYISVNLFDDSKKSLVGLSDAMLLEIYNQKRRFENNNGSTEPFLRYHRFLQENQLIDYIDLEKFALNYLLKKQDSVIEQFKYTHIFVDEFQDTSDIQFELLKCLSKESRSVFSVGDPDQSIYRFRGTGEKVIQNYLKYFKAKVFVLDYNYRCKKQIVLYANRLIACNKRRIKKTLIAYKEEHGVVSVHRFDSLESETLFVMDRIKSFIGIGYLPKDIAILYRNHSDASMLKNNLGESYYMDINLLTLHQSKGLEFKIVFIIGNKVRKYQNKKELEEERRLFFVGMTRAMDKLLISVLTKTDKPRFVKELKCQYET